MPYKRRTYRRKKYNKRSKKKSVATKAYVDRKISTQIETKCFSGGFGIDTGVNTNGVIHDLTRIIPGVNQGERVGNDILLKKLVFSAYVTLGSSSFLSTDEYQNVRMFLFRWREDSSVSTPTLNDLLDIASASVAYGVQMPYNYNTRQKYDILWDKTVQVSPEPEYNGSTLERVAAGPNVNKIVKKTLYGKKLGAKHIKYNDNAVVSSHGYNKLYLCAFSDSSVAPNPSVTWVSQLFFEDA